MNGILKLWNLIKEWKGWGRIFLISPAAVVILAVISGVGLSWVFMTGREETVLAFLIYPVSAYSLTVLILLLCRVVPKLSRRLKDSRFFLCVLQFGEDGAFDLQFYGEQIINFCYGGFKLLSGICLGSAWIGADGLYNFTQGLIQLYQILVHRRSGDQVSQWKAYRRCGAMMIFVNLTMTGLVFQMIHLGRHEQTTEISMIATAAFTFYKLVNEIIHVARDRKHQNPVDSAVRFLDFGQSLYNLFVLQVGLLWTFGGAEYPYMYLMNSLTGFAVCLLVCGIGVYMLWRSRRDMEFLKASQ